MTALLLVESRIQAGLPWLRGSLILWSVAGITCLGAIAHVSREQEQQGSNSHAKLKGIVCVSSFCFIHYLASASPLPLLLLDRFAPHWGGAQIFLTSCYSVFLVGVLLDSKRSREARRRAWLFFAFVFFAQLIFGLLGFERLLMTGQLHIPVPGFILFGPAFRGTLTAMLVLVLVATLLTGSSWCSMLCYFGPFDLGLPEGRQ